MHPLLRRLLAVAATAVVATLALGGCGGGEQRVALPIQRAERPDGVIVFHVECADDIEVELRPDPAGSGLLQVTVWGDPRVGTCDTEGRASARDLLGRQFVDGATSQVMTIAVPA